MWPAYTQGNLKVSFETVQDSSFFDTVTTLRGLQLPPSSSGLTYL